MKRTVSAATMMYTNGAFYSCVSLARPTLPSCLVDAKFGFRHKQIIVDSTGLNDCSVFKYTSNAHSDFVTPQAEKCRRTISFQLFLDAYFIAVSAMLINSEIPSWECDVMCRIARPCHLSTRKKTENCENVLDTVSFHHFSDSI